MELAGPGRMQVRASGLALAARELRRFCDWWQGVAVRRLPILAGVVSTRR